MGYATFDDVQKRYPPISTMIGSDTATEIATLDVTSIYVYGAEGIVNGYLGAKYVTPLVADPLVTMVSVDIALYKMMEDKLPRLPDWALARYTAAISILENVRDGKMVLSNSQTVVSTGDQDAWSSTGSFHPTFSPVLDPLDQRVDDNYVSVEQDIRSGDV